MLSTAKSKVARESVEYCYKCFNDVTNCMQSEIGEINHKSRPINPIWLRQWQIYNTTIRYFVVNCNDIRVSQSINYLLTNE